MEIYKKDPTKILCKRVQMLRKSFAATQKEIAQLLDITPAQYSNMESGKSKMSVEVLAGISTIYKISADYLLGLTNNPRIYR